MGGPNSDPTIDEWIDQILNEGSQPSAPAAPTGQAPPITQKPAGISDWAWNQYLAAVRDYNDAWDESKWQSQYGNGLGDPALTTRINNATSLLAKAKAAVDDEVASVNKGTSASAWSSGSTSSPYLVRQKSDGTLEQIENPNYRPPQGSTRADRYPEDVEYAQLRNQEMQQKLSGGSPWEQAWKQQEFDYKKQQDDIARQQFQQQQELAKKRASWDMAADLMNTQLKAAPMAAIPGQTYFLGAEPGGIMQNIASLSGRGYDPEKYRAPIINYDPNQAWQQAWGAMQ